MAAALPGLTGVPDGGFTNVLCETVVMHLPPSELAASLDRLMALLAPGGTLFLSWRVAGEGGPRDEHGRLYAAVDPGLVRQRLSPAGPLYDQESVSESSGRRVHRLVARKPRPGPGQGHGPGPVLTGGG